MSTSRGVVFYGWWVALTAALGLFIGPIPITVFSFSVFLKPLTQEFHSGRGAISFAFTLHNLISGMLVPLAGWLIDRFGARRVILPSMCMAAVTLLSVKWYASSLWGLYVFYAALGLFSCAAGPVPYASIISHWFDKYRGLALGVMMFGLGLGALIMPSVAQYLIARSGWHFAFGVVGAGMLLIALPVVAKCLKDRPEELGVLPDGAMSRLEVAEVEDRPTQAGVSWHEAWHTRTFWLLLTGFILVSASVHACFTHMAAILTEQGSAAQLGALASSTLGAGLLIGRAGSGYLLDRFFAPYVAAVIFVAAGAGMGLLRIASTQELEFAAALLIGIALGAEGDVIPYLTSRYFGLRSFGTICGVTFAGFALSGGLGAYLMGMAFDARGSYGLQLVFCSIAAFSGAGLMTCLGPYRYRAGAAQESVPQPGILELPL